MRAISGLRSLAFFLALSAALTWASLADAQFTLTAEDVSGLPGETVTVAVTLDADQTSFGFSLGIAHNGDDLTLDAINIGSELELSNGGAEPDFYVVDTDPDGGPGGTVFCVVSDLGTFFLPAGNAIELVLFDYTINAGAAAAAESELTFTSDLGAPPISTVVSDGISYIPTLNNGSVLVELPPVTNVSCEVTDVCICGVTVNWTTESDYDEFDILLDGEVEATLLGTESSAVVNLISGTGTIAVVGRTNGVDAPAIGCLIECPPIPIPDSPTAFVCSVDTSTCTVNVSWLNPQPMQTIEVSLDGVLLETLLGNETSTTVDLDDELMHEITLAGTGPCGVSFEAVTCEVICDESAPVFLRGDADNNGTVFGLIDAFFILEFGFNNGPSPDCEDAADADDNGVIFALIDAVYILQFALAGGPPPPAPGATTCGSDATSDTLDCLDPPDNCP